MTPVTVAVCVAGSKHTSCLTITGEDRVVLKRLRGHQSQKEQGFRVEPAVLRRFLSGLTGGLVLQDAESPSPTVVSRIR